MIIGIGVDIIEVARISRAVARRGDRFLRRVFAEEETAVCSRRRQSGPCYAARFAAKEAVMKALGCGWGPVGWTDIIVQRASDGRPTIRLEGAAARLAKQKGIATVHVSLAHLEETAIAYAMAWGGTQNPQSDVNDW